MNLIKVFDEKNKLTLKIKNYLYDQDGILNGSILKSILSDNDIQIGMNSEGTKQIKEILYPKDFSNMKPKPLSLLTFLLSTKTNKKSIVLDFFAGTGTTGHAVMELNKIDNGERKFILCTNNEENICSDVCYPRLKNIINGYSNELGNFEGYKENLKYFKTDFVEGNPTDKNKKLLVEKSTKMLCLKEDCYEEVIKEKEYSVFKNPQNKYLGIIYDDEGIEPFKKEIVKLNKSLIVYVFSLDESAKEEEFEDISELVKLKPIPAAILNVYRRIFR